MAFSVVVGGVVRHVSYCTIPGQVSTTKRDWQCINITGGSSLASADVLVDLDTAMSSLFIDAISNQATYYGSQLYYQTPVGPAPRPDATTGNQNIGINVSPLLPTQVCGLVSLYSNDLGKSGQGRVYVPFPYQGAQDVNGSPDAGYMAGLANFAVILTTPRGIASGGAVGTFVPVLYVPGGPPPKRLISGIPRDAWATQRRRGDYGRLNANPF